MKFSISPPLRIIRTSIVQPDAYPLHPSIHFGPTAAFRTFRDSGGVLRWFVVLVTMRRLEYLETRDPRGAVVSEKGKQKC